MGFARAVLTALAWGFGAGLPEPEWVTVASALVGAASAGTPPPGTPVTGREITWVLDELGRYIVQDGEICHFRFNVAK